jgi:CDP-glucose 4,6-dehydratase
MFNNCFKNKKILITGHTGFKGSWLTMWLKILGADLVGISKDIPTKVSLFEELQLVNKIKHHYININNLELLKEIFIIEQPDFVFHLAAQPIVSISYKDPIETFQTNVIGTLNVLESLKCIKNKCQVILITSDKCYRNIEWVWGYKENDELGGYDPYSASKAAAELVIRSYVHSFFKSNFSNIQITSVRAGNVIGGGDWAENRIVPDCMRAWSNNQLVSIRNPNSTRPWQHVLEPLSGYLRLAQLMYDNSKNLHGESFNFGPNSDQNHSVIDIINELSLYFSKKNKDQYYKLQEQNDFHEAGLLKLNCDKALTYLEWKPVLDFKATAKFTSLWYDEFYNKTHNNIFDFTINQIQDFQNIAKLKGISWSH